MKAYREAFVSGLGSRGLSQEELLRRMADVDDECAQRFSHTTVSRWESGATRPTVDRLRAFGKALNLSGLAENYQDASNQSVGREDPPVAAGGQKSESDVAGILARTPASHETSLLREVMRFFVFRLLVSGALIAGFHLMLSAMGWNNTWMPVICVAFAWLVVLGPGFVLPDESAGLREFYWISVFFILTTPLLQFVPLGMDHYNVHQVTGFGGTMMPYMLALLTNLLLAWTAGLMFHLLRRWRYRDGTTVGGTVTGAASVCIPPLGVVYTVVLITTNFSVAVQLSVVFAALPMAFALLLVFRDTGVTFTDRDRSALFSAMVVAACVSVPVGFAVIMSIYLSPDFPSVLPDHNLIRSWQLDFNALGYTSEEALDRVNLGYVWHATALMIYMACVVGGRLFMEIHRLGAREEPA